MFIFWIVILSFIAILILGIILTLWSNTLVYISYIGESFQIKIKNIFFRYTYPSKKSKKNKESNKDKKKKFNIKNKISNFLKETTSDSNASDSSSKEEVANGEENDEKSDMFYTVLGVFKSFSKDKKETLILVKNIVIYLIKYLRYKLYIKKLKLSVDYGNKDAANTGIACGAFWTGYGIILPILKGYFHLNTPSVRFTPRFNDEISEIGFESIIQVKLGHIINAIILSAFRYIKKHYMR